MVALLKHKTSELIFLAEIGEKKGKGKTEAGSPEKPWTMDDGGNLNR